MSASRDHIGDLAAAVRGLTAPFCCGGTYVADAPVRVRLPQAQQVAGSGCSADPAASPVFLAVPSKDIHSQQKDAAPLIAACQKAPFGHGASTQYNPAVRDALQLKADSFQLENFDPEASGILSLVKEQLLSSDPDAILAEPYALNVYKPFGHFKTHKDTPRGADMFGTLVVCLPLRFTAGKFVVSHKGVDRSFNWGSNIGNGRNANRRLQWCAFFGDCDHRIEEVWSGARVTVSYILRHSNPAALKTRKREVAQVEPASHTHAVCVAMESALADPSFMPEGGTLGFPCFHMYSNEVFPAGGNCSTALTLKQARKLKGRDAEVALCVLSAAGSGLTVKVQPFLVEDCADDTWELGKFPTRMMKYRVTLDTIEDKMGGSLSEDCDVEWVLDTPHPRSRANIVKKSMPDNPDPNRPPLLTIGDSCLYSATGYFGNEASYASFYVWAGLLVNVPPAGQGVRANLQDAAQRPALLERWAADAAKNEQQAFGPGLAIGSVLVPGAAGTSASAGGAKGPAAKKPKTAKQCRPKRHS